MLHHPNQTQAKNWLKIGLLLLLSFIIWHLGIQPARAATWTICQSDDCDFNDIQSAVNNAAVMDDDVLVFTINRETYAPFTVTNKALTLQGYNTEVDGAGLGTAVTITNGNKTVSFSSFTILGGSNANGAGILLNSGNLELDNVFINNSHATNFGGGLYIAGNSSTLLTDVTFNNNSALAGGSIYNDGSLMADDLTITLSYAENGAGLYNNGTVNLTDGSNLRQNGSKDSEITISGGALFNASSGNLTLNKTDIANNNANNGAGVYNNGIIQIIDTNIRNFNEATQAGGGLYNTGQATLTHSAIVQNNSNMGAGIFNTGTITAENSTLSRNAGIGNTPVLQGAGLYNDGTASLNNITFHLNNGASIFANSGTVNVGNTIISSAGQDACDGNGLMVSNGYNLASDQSCTFLLTTLGDIQGLDPNLNSIDGISGINSPTDSAAFHAPKLTSPVIDAGNPATPGSGGNSCLASDQRGLARPQSSRCDIGAVEIVVYRLFVPSVTK